MSGNVRQCLISQSANLLVQILPNRFDQSERYSKNASRSFFGSLSPSRLSLISRSNLCRKIFIINSFYTCWLRHRFWLESLGRILSLPCERKKEIFKRIIADLDAAFSQLSDELKIAPKVRSINSFESARFESFKELCRGCSAKETAIKSIVHRCCKNES